MSDIDARLADLNQRIADLAKQTQFVLSVAMTCLSVLEREGRLTEADKQGILQRPTAADGKPN